ncbi:MAG TPA: hypothetical protein VNW92_23745, partial [Polyangiaceae bacterium]|nr:hypothetical protein [Polyangiaceae bacterium]
FQSSGAISLELVAGHAYIIGVSVSDGTFVYYYDSATTPPSLNFAHAVGSFAGTFALTQNSYVTPGTLYYSRLTTTAP